MSKPWSADVVEFEASINKECNAISDAVQTLCAEKSNLEEKRDVLQREVDEEKEASCLLWKRYTILREEAEYLEDEIDRTEDWVYRKEVKAKLATLEKERCGMDAELDKMDKTQNELRTTIRRIENIHFDIKKKETELLELKKAHEKIMKHVFNIAELYRFFSQEQLTWMIRAVMTRADWNGRVIYAIPGTFTNVDSDFIEAATGLYMSIRQYNDKFAVFSFSMYKAYATGKPLIMRSVITRPGNLYVDSFVPEEKPWIYTNDNECDFRSLAQRLNYAELKDGKICRSKWSNKRENEMVTLFRDTIHQGNIEYVADEKDCKHITIPVVFRPSLFDFFMTRDVASALIKAGVNQGVGDIYVYPERIKPDEYNFPRVILHVWVKK